ncbi:MAG: lipoyl(octanoyl) transferase LipB [Gammaproteobacteria bacterium]
MNLIVRYLGLIEYAVTFEEMRRFAGDRDASCADEIWCLEHPPVFTQGQGGRADHVHDTKDIPIVRSDRGGQVTYHGPGQLVVYVLMDIRRQGIGPRELVKRIESGLINTLKYFEIDAERRGGAPGVYVGQSKIAALGLRIRRGTSYHGLSLNVDVDLEPFTRIDPCGFKGLEVTRLCELGVNENCTGVAARLLPELIAALYGDSQDIEIETFDSLPVGKHGSEGEGVNIRVSALR